MEPTPPATDGGRCNREARRVKRYRSADSAAADKLAVHTTGKDGARRWYKWSGSSSSHLTPFLNSRLRMVSTGPGWSSSTASLAIEGRPSWGLGEVNSVPHRGLLGNARAPGGNAHGGREEYDRLDRIVFRPDGGRGRTRRIRGAPVPHASSQRMMTPFTYRALEVGDFETAGRLLVESYPYRAHEHAARCRRTCILRPTSHRAIMSRRG